LNTKLSHIQMMINPHIQMMINPHIQMMINLNIIYSRQFN